MRLFVALPVPQHIAEALLDTMEGIAGARWQDADNLHITLAFVGEVTRHQAQDLSAALESVAWRDMALRITGVGTFEKKGRATAVWAGLAQNSDLIDLQIRVANACRRAGLAVEARKFVPHVTLARLNSAAAPVGEWLMANSGLSLARWQAEGFALYESHLERGGSRYEQLARYPLV